MKRWTVVLLSLAMALSGLSIGCGGEKDTGKKNTGGGGSKTPPATQPSQGTGK